MIFEFIFDFFFNSAVSLLNSLLGSFTFVFVFSGTAFDIFVDILKASNYFLPTYTLLPLFAVWLWIWLWRVFCSLVKTIWNLLPFA